ncbi:MAG: EamA family transporter [Candidatus Woesearchaeota archaeon]
MSSVWTILGMMIVATMIGAVGSLFLKLGSEKFNIHISIKGIIDILKNWKIIFGVFLYLVSSVFFIMILKITDLSIAYPMTSMTYIFTTILSYKFLGEKINRYKIIGIACIILGVALVKF